MKGFYLFLPFLHLLLLYPVLLLGRSSVWESNSNQTTTSISESSSVIETQSTNSPSYDHQVTIQEIVDGVISNSQNGDLYKVLDIKLCNGWQCRESDEPSSTELAVMIRQSFRNRSKVMHPDKISDLSIVDADKAIIELITAYDRLKEPESRKEYDRTPISTCVVGNRICSFYSRFTDPTKQVKTSSQGSQSSSSEFSQVSAMHSNVFVYLLLSYR